MRIIKKILIPVLTIIMLCCIACSPFGVNYSLPRNPVVFEEVNFVDPNNNNDNYVSIEYKDRTYISYRTLNGELDMYKVGPCIGYVSKNQEDKNDRIFITSGSANKDYLIRIYVDEKKDQVTFLRAVDTVGKEIDTPEYIKSSNYNYWK